MERTDQISRILLLFYNLSKGGHIDKTLFSIENNITERSFDRDIENIRNFLCEIHANHELIFKRDCNSYCLTNCQDKNISALEISAFFDILLSSRAFRSDEMDGCINTLCRLIPAGERTQVLELLHNGLENYVGSRHNKAILKLHWDLGQSILRRQIIEFEYHKSNGTKNQYSVSPISVIFSNHNFYLLAFIEGEMLPYPSAFRLDRFDSFKITGKSYPAKVIEKYNSAKYGQHFISAQEGALIDIKLKCQNIAVEDVLDNIPNARIIQTNDDFAIIKVKVFREGFLRWVLGEGETVEIIEPLYLREEAKGKLLRVLSTYNK